MSDSEEIKDVLLVDGICVMYQGIDGHLTYIIDIHDDGEIKYSFFDYNDLKYLMGVMCSDSEKVNNNNRDWQLKSHIDFIHIEFYDPLDVKLLHRLLLDDIEGLIASYGVECDPSLFVDIVNRRFGNECVK